MIPRVVGYLMTIVACAMLTATVQSLITVPKMKRISALAGGCLLLLAVLTPLVTIDLTQIQIPELLTEAPEVSQMESEARQRLNRDIKQRTEAYILDKAGDMGAIIRADVEVMETENGYGVPCGVTITGCLTNGQRQKLSELMETELGIPPEHQIWRTI